MHIFFSGIGGTGIGPLAQVAKKAGYKVSGSDKQDSDYIKYLNKHGLNDIHIGQTKEQLEIVHTKAPIDWYIYSSAITLEQPDSAEIEFCKSRGIKVSKRNEFLNHFLKEKDLKLIAIAGTHGKTTTTAMVVWLFKQLGDPVSYTLPSKVSFGEMGEYNPKSKFFIYEADEFDRNFLAFSPFISLISGLSWDHHEIYQTEQDYKDAFKDFINQSNKTYIWKDDANYLAPNLDDFHNLNTLDAKDIYKDVNLVGSVNRKNATLAIKAVLEAFGLRSNQQLIKAINEFPGLSRRMEKITDNLYSDYAHTTEKIKGCLDTAFELSKNVVVVYEPLTNRRQHFIKQDYRHLFEGVKKLYWVPSYLAREDPKQKILSPSELIEEMANKQIAEPALLNDKLAKTIRMHTNKGDLVVAISGGGGGSLDEWLRKNFSG
jgi:UDP-N-acetylmuramate--alanine ligase